MSNNVTKTVKDLVKEGKAINLMTPGGFVYLSADQVEMISRGDITEINSNSGFRGSDMPMDISELLGYELVRGSYNEKTDVNEYLVG